MMRIHTPEIIHDRESVALRSEVEYAGRKDQLWYSVLPDWAEYLTVKRCDAFLVGLLPVAMNAGEDIHVAGIISERLYYNLTHYYINILSASIPSLHKIQIFADNLDTGELCPTKGAVGTGFSGGIDSLCVVADHLLNNNISDKFKISHFVFNNVGAHGRGKMGRDLFLNRYERITPLVEEIGIPIILVDSNLSELLGRNFQQTVTPRNISVALVLQKLFGKFLYASTYRYEDCYVGEAHDMGFSDPLAVHLLSTETTDCISTGCQYSRVEKIMRVAEIECSKKYITVCGSHQDAEKNCSLCWKCLGVLVTLDILGKLQRYNTSFDLNRYSKIRQLYMARVLSSKDPLLREIVEYAAKNNYRFPIIARSLAAMLRIIYPNSKKYDHLRLARRYVKYLGDKYRIT